MRGVDRADANFLADIIHLPGVCRVTKHAPSHRAHSSLTCGSNAS